MARVLRAPEELPQEWINVWAKEMAEAEDPTTWHSPEGSKKYNFKNLRYK